MIKCSEELHINLHAPILRSQKVILNFQNFVFSLKDMLVSSEWILQKPSIAKMLV